MSLAGFLVCLIIRLLWILRESFSETGRRRKSVTSLTLTLALALNRNFEVLGLRVEMLLKLGTELKLVVNRNYEWKHEVLGYSSAFPNTARDWGINLLLCHSYFRINHPSTYDCRKLP